MIQYITNFIVYTLAMIGILVIAFVVYKKVNTISTVKKSRLIKVIDMVKLPDRKTLYVVGCKDEMFLVGSSNDNISLISKLQDENNDYQLHKEQVEKYLNERPAVQDNPYANDTGSGAKKQIIKSLLKELSDINQTKRGEY